jgi:hypothetical protein
MELPPLDAIDVSELAEYGALMFLDDSEADPGLPEEVAPLATYPETSPMTGCEPWCWGEEAAAEVAAIAATNRFTLTDASALMNDLSDPL